LAGSFFDRDIRTPVFYQFHASVQYQIGADLLLEAASVGPRGLNLFRQMAINQARLASAANPTVNPARRGDYNEHAGECPATCAFSRC
jgi:hypothetical protein